MRVGLVFAVKAFEEKGDPSLEAAEARERIDRGL
jgi:hypothetical protein